MLSLLYHPKILLEDSLEVKKTRPEAELTHVQIPFVTYYSLCNLALSRLCSLSVSHRKGNNTNTKLIGLLQKLNEIMIKKHLAKRETLSQNFKY